MKHIIVAEYFSSEDRGRFIVETYGGKSESRMNKIVNELTEMALDDSDHPSSIVVRVHTISSTKRINNKRYVNKLINQEEEERQTRTEKYEKEEYERLKKKFEK